MVKRLLLLSLKKRQPHLHAVAVALNFLMGVMSAHWKGDAYEAKISDFVFGWAHQRLHDEVAN
jgi:hypothetical protein